MNRIVTKDTIESLNLSPELKARLQDRFMDRNEDLLLDILEQIEMHKREIVKLTKQANKISEQGYVNADQDE